MELAKVPLGRQGLIVGKQGLGCRNLTGWYGKPFDKATATAAVDKAVELGVTLFDTADSYSFGANDPLGAGEELLGGLLQRHRAKVAVATKFGRIPPVMGSKKGLRNDPPYIRSACEASLRRLGVECIDLYYCHRIDPAVPIEETVGVMAELVAAGKVRYLGLSSVAADTLRRAHRVHPITALQSEWSLWTRDIEHEVLPQARLLGIGIVPYAPLGRGFLTGAVKSQNDLAADDSRRKYPRFQGENLAHNLALVEVVEQLAAAKSCTPAQVALAWLHHQGKDVVPIPGASRLKNVTENTAAVNQRLEAGDRAAIDKVFRPGVALGERYADMSEVSDAPRD